jgi:hypothetical protein
LNEVFLGTQLPVLRSGWQEIAGLKK